MIWLYSYAYVLSMNTSELQEQNWVAVWQTRGHAAKPEIFTTAWTSTKVPDPDVEHSTHLKGIFSCLRYFKEFNLAL